jgi:hypothetical protein
MFSAIDMGKKICFIADLDLIKPLGTRKKHGYDG